MGEKLMPPICSPESWRSSLSTEPILVVSRSSCLTPPGRVVLLGLGWADVIWKDKLRQKAGVLRDHINRSVTHIFAVDVKSLTERVGSKRLKNIQSIAFRYDWLEDCLKTGIRVPAERYLLLSIKEDAAATSDASTQSIAFPGDSLNGSALLDAKRKHDPGSAEDGAESDDNSHKRKRDDLMYDQHSSECKGDLRDGYDSNNSDSDAQVSLKSGRQSPFKSPLAQGLARDSENMLSEASPKYTPPNLNKKITSIFDELKNIYGDALGDDRRSFSYYKANSVLEKLPFKISTVNEVKGLPSIGKSLGDQIIEIVKTGKSSRLEHFKEDEKVHAVSLFSSVWGIGPHTAQKLYDKGHRTLADLERDETLTPPQRLGLKFRDDINKKIPRHEVRDMEVLVEDCACSINPKISVVCGGSYRRGKEMVGDLDFVITHPDGKSHAGLLRKLVSKLQDMDFLTEALTVGMDHKLEERGVDTYFGLCKYPGREQRHRIDLKVYPYEMYPFGLIAWTGNDVLNRRLRLVAEAHGYKLDDHGLFPVTRDAEGHRLKGVSVVCRTEREVFEKLEVPWLEPHERNL